MDEEEELCERVRERQRERASERASAHEPRIGMEACLSAIARPLDPT